MPVRFVEVGDQRAAAGDVDHLQAAADRQKRASGALRPRCDGHVEGILYRIDVVEVVVAVTAVKCWADVAATGQQDSVDEVQPVVDVGGGDIGAGMDGERFAAGGVDRFDQLAGIDLGSEPQR